MPRSLRAFGALVALLSILAFSLPALADEVRTTGPSRHMFHKGIVVLVLSYVPALVVAIESDLEGDKYLYAPVAGPWLDLAKRDCPNCDHEGANVGGLITDGVFQGLGALSIATSFLFRETRVSSATPQHSRRDIAIRVAPMPGASGVALALRF